MGASESTAKQTRKVLEGRPVKAGCHSGSSVPWSTCRVHPVRCETTRRRSSPPLASLWRPCADIASGVDSEQTHRQPQRRRSVPISPADSAELCRHDLENGRDDRIST
jgi:hypothetical protein